ncbi:PKD domain-containing protein [Blastococcus sp. HT6-30]|uniref:PKD domain-containing protein n=1 Tax=Blastococcus sp. HT6-30 TaxID=3144843 RepID=UPI00321ADC4C
MRLLCGLVVTAILATLIGATGPASAGAAHDGVVSEAPSARTPQILDGRVLDLAEVGDRIVVAGTFTQVRDANGNGGTTFDQAYVFAFDPVTGAVDRSFRPQLNATVNAVSAGAGGTVYVGGTFTILNGAASRNLVQLSLATGLRTDGFRAGNINGAVNDLEVSGNRLFVAGIFTTVGGVPHGGLATVDATTGALDEYMGIDVLENHNWPRGTARAAVGVEKIAISPDRSRLVAIGNFRTADGLPRDQVVSVQLQAGSAVVDPDWRTTRYEPACSSWSFDTYVRDVDFAPDGSYFVIVSTGGSHPGTLCDAAGRFDTASTGQAVEPRWVNETGGDTLFSVEVTGSAVYVGGHQRWMNNPTGRDSAGPGAVPRPGLAALDPSTGLPLAWNAARHPRGVGAQAILATASGLYVGSDTEYIGNREYFRPRLAFLELAGGSSVAPAPARQLPATVVLAGGTTTGLLVSNNVVRGRFFDGTAAAADVSIATGDTDWSRARGAFMAGDTLYYGYPSGTSYALYRRTFDGVTFGAATLVDPYNDPEWSDVATGSTRNGEPIRYRGALPSFYGQLSSVTGMTYADGRIYYTRSGALGLYYRSFSLDSGVVGGTEFTAAGSGFGSVAGMFVSGGQLYWANSVNGELRRIALVGGVPSGASVVAAAGPWTRGGADWRTRAMFLGPQPNVAPTASFASDCLGLVCSLDGTGSTDGDGTVTAYSWAFGDGTTATGPEPSKTYGAAGSYQVTLTVTDDDGATASTTRTVTVAPVASGEGIAVRDSVGTSARVVTSASLTVPASVQAGDALVLALTTNSDAAGQVPAGYTLVGTQTSGTSMTTQVFSRVATAADAGSTVTVDLTKQAKVTLQLAAYSGVDWRSPIASVTGAADVGGTAHTTPTTTVETGSWVISVWSDRSSSARSFTAPSAAVVRTNLSGVGNGDIASLMADRGAPVPAGQVGGLTATVPVASNRATMLTVVLAPGNGSTPPANVPPTAAIESTCATLTCSFDGTGSSDTDGTVTGFAWDFGDGQVASTATAEHTYATAGEYEVSLTVTDDDGATSVATSTVTVAAPPPPVSAGIGLRGSAGTSDRVVTSAALEVPGSVQAGDGLVLVLSTNSTVTGAAPAGWTEVGRVSANDQNPTTQVFSRVAGAGDAGTTVTVALSGQAKVTLQLMAYSGTAEAGPVASFTAAADGAGTAHTTPTATAAEGNWVLSVWSDKQRDERQWTPPSAGVTERSNIAGVGSGDIATLLTDSGGPVPAGPVGGLTATVPTPSNRATMLTLVLAQGGTVAPPANVPPTAAIESTCATLTCSFDGTGSSDTDGTVTGFAWDFGDGQVASTATAEHTYATAGEYEVSLTVTDDDGATSVATSTVTVAAPPPPVSAGIGLRGSAGTSDRVVTSAALEVPGSVQAGDGLVLVLSTNSTVTGAAPAGWTEVGRVSANDQNPTTQVFSRVAGAGDAGTTVTVALSGQAKVTLQLMAYSGTAEAGPVASFTAAADGAGTAHTTPTATAAEGNWVLSVWSDKQRDERQWTPPSAGVTERSNIAGVGSGDIATLLTDSGGPVPAGPVGGLTATVPTPSNRATMLTLVLAQA